MIDRDTGTGSLGRYRLVHRLGHGGMGEVYLARAEGTGGWHKDVVIKRILPHLVDDPDLRTRFLDEGRIAARLSHAHVVQVFDVGEEGRTLYLAMEAVDGWDLRTVLRICRDGVPLPDRLALAVASAIAAALAHAHSRTDPDGRPLEIVHRDVSPANILLSREGEVKLTDFGIAAATSRAEKTLTGELKGKVAYMAPEQARGAPVDARADIYALGLVLFEMLTGQRALGHGSEMEVLDRARAGRRPALETLRPDLPSAVVEVVERALQTEAPDRYPDAETLGKALASGASALGGAASPLDLRDWLAEHVAPVTASTLAGGFVAGDAGLATGESGRAIEAEPSRSATETILPEDAIRPHAGASSGVDGAGRSEDPRPRGPQRFTRGTPAVGAGLLGSVVVAAVLWVLLLERAEVEVRVGSTPAGAVVHIDDRLLGETPVSTALRPGVYAVRLSREGSLPHADVLRVRRGQPQELEIALMDPPAPPQPEAVRTVFHSLPPGAMVQVEGGEPFLAGNATSVAVGRPLRIRYTLEGYLPLEEELVLQPGDGVVTRALVRIDDAAVSEEDAAEERDMHAAPSGEALAGSPTGRDTADRSERRALSRPGAERTATDAPRRASSPAVAVAEPPDPQVSEASSSSSSAVSGVLAVRFTRAPMLGEIRIEGGERRASRGLVEEFDLPPGRYRVEVVNEGFGVRQQTTVHVVEGERRTWTVDWGESR